MSTLTLDAEALYTELRAGVGALLLEQWFREHP